MAGPKPYSSEYQKKCFQIFYLNNRPSGKPLKELIPEEDGRKPTASLLNDWRDELLWDVRADELDVRVEQASDDYLVAEKSLMLKEQAAAAREMQKMGMTYLRDEGFDSSSSAVAAIIKGADLEQTARGLSDTIRKLSKMDGDGLLRHIENLAKNLPDSVSVIDGEEIQEKKKENIDDEIDDTT